MNRIKLTLISLLLLSIFSINSVLAVPVWDKVISKHTYKGFDNYYGYVIRTENAEYQCSKKVYDFLQVGQTYEFDINQLLFANSLYKFDVIQGAKVSK